MGDRPTARIRQDDIPQAEQKLGNEELTPPYPAEVGYQVSLL